MPKLIRIELKRVEYIPKVLEPGILYVAEEFDAALHLCACGCMTKVSTPLGGTEWRLEETPEGPSLCPSVGNWQFPCQSHYWINRGAIEWCKAWSEAQILSGRQAEEERRHAYYESRRPKPTWYIRAWEWIKSLFS